MKAAIARGRKEATSLLKVLLAKTPPGQTLLVCKPRSFAASGAQDWLQNLAPNLPTFSDFSPNPKAPDVAKGIQTFLKARTEFIIAVGGGSVLDMAKLINYYGSTSRSPELPAHDTPGATPLKPLLAIPTTAGSGSEATHFAVMYRNQKKLSIANPLMRPSYVMLIPEFTASAPPYLTACTGMDALCQAIESSWANQATAESRRCAHQAIELARANIREAVASPTLASRTCMQEAAYLAGCAINVSKTTAAHAFSYFLTSHFNIPHGHAVSLLLPFFMAYHRKHDITADGIDERFFKSLLQDLQLSITLPIDARPLAKLLQENVNLERLSNNPVNVSTDAINELAQQLCREQPPVSLGPEPDSK